MGNTQVLPPMQLKSRNTQMKKFKRGVSQSSEMILILEIPGFTIVEISSLLVFHLGYSSRNDLVSKKVFDLLPESQPDTGLKTMDLIDELYIKIHEYPDFSTESKIYVNREDEIEQIAVKLQFVKVKSDFFIEVFVPEPDILDHVIEAGDEPTFEETVVMDQKMQEVETEPVKTKKESTMKREEEIVREQVEFTNSLSSLTHLVENLDFGRRKQAKDILEGMNSVFGSLLLSTQELGRERQMAENIMSSGDGVLYEKLGSLMTSLDAWNEVRERVLSEQGVTDSSSEFSPTPRFG